MASADEHCQNLVQAVNHPEIREHPIIRIDIRLFISAEAKAAQLKNSRGVPGRNGVEFPLFAAGINAKDGGWNSRTLHQDALIGFHSEHHVVRLNLRGQRLGITTVYRIQEQDALLINAKNIFAVWCYYNTKGGADSLGRNRVRLPLPITEINPDRSAGGRSIKYQPGSARYPCRTKMLQRIVCESARLAGPHRQHVNLRHRLIAGYRQPFSIRRKRSASTVCEANCRRSIGVTHEHAILRANRFTALREDRNFAVRRKIVCSRPIEPGEIAFGFLARRHSYKPVLGIVLPQKSTSFASNIVQGESAGNAQ